MLTNKITIELELPVLFDEEEAESVSQLLIAQTEFLTRFWKESLADLKEKGITVPTISARGLAVKKTTPNESKEFVKALIEHHLKFQPKALIGDQMKSIRTLFETGVSAEELIKLYELSRQEYALTTWHTVKYKMGKIVPEADGRVELDEESVEKIRQRYAK